MANVRPVLSSILVFQKSPLVCDVRVKPDEWDFPGSTPRPQYLIEPSGYIGPFFPSRVMLKFIDVPLTGCRGNVEDGDIGATIISNGFDDMPVPCNRVHYQNTDRLTRFHMLVVEMNPAVYLTQHKQKHICGNIFMQRLLEVEITRTVLVTKIVRRSLPGIEQPDKHTRVSPKLPGVTVTKNKYFHIAFCAHISRLPAILVELRMTLQPATVSNLASIAVVNPHL